MEQIDLADILAEWERFMRLDMHTAMPCQVLKYYPATQTADVKPMLKQPDFDPETGDRLDPITLPTLPQVPVIWPRAGGFVITMPMQVGDFVWVMFSEGGTGEFRAGGQEAEPFDVSRQSLTYPYCMPGAFPDTAPIDDAAVTANNNMVIGSWGADQQIQISATQIILGRAAASFVALSSLVDSAISAIVTAFSGHSHDYIPYPGGTAGAPVATTNNPTLGAQPSTAAGITKAQ